MAKLKVLNKQSEFYGKAEGSYYIRKLKNGWLLYHQSFLNGKRVHNRVERLAYPELGFQNDWSLSDARARCKILNQEKTLIQSKAREASARLMELESIDDLLFPADRVSAFSLRLEQDNEGTLNHLKKMNSHFLKVQKLCKDLKILPVDYKDNEKRIYKWLAQNRVSLDYSQKLIALLNRWGTFVSRVDGRFFEPIRPIKGISREKVREAHEGKRGVRTESKPLAPELLLSKKDKLSPQNFNFLFATVWFGLRPSEVPTGDDVVIQKNPKGLEFLVVYQGKLVGIEKSKRFKAIPILFDEQRVAVEYLKSGEIKAPIYKAMFSVFGEGYGLYAGRKGFADLMLSKGYMLEDISLWLGHTSIETTWAHYKQKNVLNLPNPRRTNG